MTFAVNEMTASIASTSFRWLFPDARDRRSALLVAAAACAVAAIVAVVVAAVAAATVRHRLGFGFAGVPHRVGEALGILADNARLAGTIGAAIVVVQSAWLAAPGDHFSAGSRLLRFLADALLTTAVVVNASVVGAAIGAYGDRMLVAALPHGPIELAAYALAIALYLRARVERLTPAATVRLIAWTLALLTLAAFAETYLQLR